LFTAPESALLREQPAGDRRQRKPAAFAGRLGAFKERRQAIFFTVNL
jgi:hypothetical protein